MCGIVGILGKHEVAPLILDALRRLEYRGYDSAGVATVTDAGLERRRAVGKLSALSDLLVHDPIRGMIGIGHTRWATHGVPNVDNAHPHQVGKVALVHNGIIENYRELRDELAASGATFASQTDTEVIAVLCNRLMDQGLSPADAAAATLARLEGAFALCFIFSGHSDLMIAARRGSPLAIGHGDGEMFVGSDALALAPLTDRITYLEEGDWAVVTRSGLDIHDASGSRVERPVKTVQIDSVMVDRGNHRHFMAKEMYEQPTVVSYAISHYQDAGTEQVRIPEGEIDFASMDRLVLVACGTGHYACAVAKYWFEQIARIPVEIDIASEFRYRDPPLSPSNGAIFVSQSGETADTLAALRHAKGKVGTVIGLVNVAESSIARESDVALPILAGAEIAVASTKAFTCQLTVLAVLAVAAGRQRGTIDAAEEKRLMRVLSEAPGAINRALGLEPDIARFSADLARARDILFLGRGSMYPVALEGALKLKELSYIHAEGYASGELKHGPIALIDGDVPVIVMAPRDALFDKTVSNMQEVMARAGRILLISDKDGITAHGQDAWHSLEMPRVDPFIAPLVYAIPAQLIAYHTALAKGTDVDQPRNLAKSVTVE